MPAPPGQTRLAALIKSFLKVSTRNEDGSIPTPTWDDTDIMFPSFFDAILEWYPTVDSAYLPLEQYGYVRSGRTTAVTSTEHAIALHTDTVSPGSPLSPAPSHFVPNATALVQIAAYTTVDAINDTFKVDLRLWLSNLPDSRRQDLDPV